MSDGLKGASFKTIVQRVPLKVANKENGHPLFLCEPKGEMLFSLFNFFASPAILFTDIPNPHFQMTIDYLSSQCHWPLTEQKTTFSLLSFTCTGSNNSILTPSC